MQRLSKNISTALEKRGWSKQHLADIAGMRREAVSRLLNGHGSITVRTAERIAEALGVTLSKLFEESKPVKTQAIKPAGKIGE